MKKCMLISLLLAFSLGIFAQAKKPTIMVVPSEAWCISNGYFIELESQGKKQKYPDYQRALQENMDMGLAISKIGELMAERGFPLKDLRATMTSINNQNAEDMLLTSKNGGELIESPIDKLRKTAKADIEMQLTWTVNTLGPKKSVTYNLQGIDTYSNKQIAASSGTGAQSFSSTVPVLLEEAVVANIDHFNYQLMNHFNDMMRYGREVIFTVRTWDDWGEDLESEYDGNELIDIINDWVAQNTVESRFNLSNATENVMNFEQVRIPLYDERGVPMDTRKWARGLQKFLKNNYSIDSKVMSRGLGHAQIVLGGK